MGINDTRLIIEIDAAQKRRLKALCSAAGISLKTFVLNAIEDSEASQYMNNSSLEETAEAMRTGKIKVGA